MVWFGSFCNVTFWMWLIWLCFGSPPQRTCSFGGFDLSNRSLHVVNTGLEANVSACKIRKGCQGHKLHSTATQNHLFSAVFSSFLYPLLLFVFPLPIPSSLSIFACPSSKYRIKNRSLYTEKWSNPPLHLGSHSGRRSSRSRRRWGNACRRSTAAPYLSRSVLKTLEH